MQRRGVVCYVAVLWCVLCHGMLCLIVVHCIMLCHVALCVVWCDGVWC